MTIKEKNELLDKLRTLFMHADQCKIICMQNGKPEDAALLSVFGDQLRAASNNLIRGIYRDWVGGTADLERWLDRANAEIEKCIEDLATDPNWPRRIAKINEYIEDIIKAASSIVIV
jgi:hypothetical protein